jgi:CelD/BcsL family acetyltransferase involved in cellulose biosynthesis
MRVEVWKGEAAQARLHSGELREEWETLYAGCPWASVFQSYSYASTWYEIYRSQFTPLIVAGISDDGVLCGLLLLALGADGNPVAAGGRQAEYQVWLARPLDGDAFIEMALDRLGAECPGRALRLRYLPPNTPIGWLRSADFAGASVLNTVRRGIMDLDVAQTEAALRKKRNRNKLNQLERVGPVTYERLTDPAAMDALIEEIIPYCDLRHGALHDVLPFRGDPLKQPFYRALARLPGLLWVSVLRCGERIASAEIDIDNRGQLALGFGGLAPSLMRSSPGRLHMLFLARDFAQQGHKSIDLTPGGGYKDLLASHFDEVYKVRVALGARRRLSWRADAAARRVAKSVIARTGADPSELMEQAARFRRSLDTAGPGSRPTRALRALKERVWSDREVQLFAIDERSSASLPGETPMRADRLADLVAYRQGVIGFEPRRAFLRLALSHLEQGSRPYTRVEGGDLIASAWVSRSPGQFDGVDLAGAVAPDTVVVHDLTMSEQLTSPSEWIAVLRQLVRDASESPNVARILVAVRGDSPDLREAIRRMSGRYAGSVYARTRAARTHQWSTVQHAPAPELARNLGTPEVVG